MGSYPLLIFCAIAMGDAIGHPYPDSQAQNSSYITWDLVSLFSGDFTNRAEVEAGLTKHDLFQTRTVPVFIPALYPDVVVLEKTAVNGTYLTRSLMVVKQDEKDENIAYMIPYTFTDPRKNKSGELHADDLYNLTMADLHQDVNCVATYVRLSKDLFSGMSFLCSPDGQHRPYGMTVACDVYTVTGPLSKPVPPTPKPYVFLRAGPRYPLINAPEDYVSPCNKSKTSE